MITISRSFYVTFRQPNSATDIFLIQLKAETWVCVLIFVILLQIVSFIIWCNVKNCAHFAEEEESITWTDTLRFYAAAHFKT